MFSEARIAFIEELSTYHKDLMDKIIDIAVESNEFDPKTGQIDEGLTIGTVAAEFGIIMDGLFSPDEMDRVYTVLIHKLREKRKEIITSIPNNVINLVEDSKEKGRVIH